jgi:hypothetical protein
MTPDEAAKFSGRLLNTIVGPGIAEIEPIFGGRFRAKGRMMVIDDYFSATEKGGPTRIQVDDLVTAGRLQPLGFYGWGDLDRSVAGIGHDFFLRASGVQRVAYERCQSRFR